MGRAATSTVLLAPAAVPDQAVEHAHARVGGVERAAPGVAGTVGPPGLHGHGTQLPLRPPASASTNLVASIRAERAAYQVFDKMYDNDVRESREKTSSQPTMSSLAACVEGYGPTLNDLKSLWTQKCNFGVDGPN